MGIRVIRKPPKINYAEPPPSEETSIVHQEESDDVLLKWSSLTDEAKRSIIQLWLQRPWGSLQEFCSVRGLNYSSVYSAFYNRGIPTNAPDRKLAAIEGLQSSLTQGIQTLESGHTAVQLAVNHLVGRLMTHGDEMTIQQLQEMMAFIAESMAKVGASLSPFKGIFDALAQPGEDKDAIDIKAKSTVLTETQRNKVAGHLTDMANDLVRQARAAKSKDGGQS